MKASKIHEILRNKQKVDIFYNERPVWIQVIIYGAWAVYTTRRVYKRSNIKTGDIEA